MKLVSRLFGLNGVRHILLCSIFSSSTGAFAFGSPGMSGQSGSSGFSGDKGPDASVIANGESQSQYLTGYSGSPGGDGTQGYSATNCSQPYNTASNQYGASGGSGGRGGYGGVAVTAATSSCITTSRKTSEIFTLTRVPDAGRAEDRDPTAAEVATALFQAGL